MTTFFALNLGAALANLVLFAVLLRQIATGPRFVRHYVHPSVRKLNQDPHHDRIVVQGIGYRFTEEELARARARDESFN